VFGLFGGRLGLPTSRRAAGAVEWSDTLRGIPPAAFPAPEGALMAMDKRDANTAGKGLIQGRLTPAGRAAATNALRQEAERGWAESDRKNAKGRQRSKAPSRSTGKKERDAEIGRPKGKLQQAQRQLKRQGGPRRAGQ
jgi:hypothetical protein